MKTFIKQFIPPVLVSVLKKKQTIEEPQSMWSGNYNSWSEVMQHCKGYDDELILEKCKNALLKVKNGEAVYERDSVLFAEKEYSTGLLTVLEKAALQDKKLCVLDFGGSLGSSYYQNKEMLSDINALQWCVVEQLHFVETGKKYFEDEQLKFYSSIEECLQAQQPNVILLSGVLQYLEKPFEWLEKFISLGIEYFILDRTAFIISEGDLLTVQNVPESIYKASYPAWFFNEEKMLSKFHKSYETLFVQNDFTNSKINIANTTAEWKIAAFKKKKSLD